MRYTIFFSLLVCFFTSDISADECQLKLRLVESDSKTFVPGLIRITDLETSKPIELSDFIKRENNWYAMPAEATHVVPARKLKIETMRGLETELNTIERDFSGKEKADVSIVLKRFIRSAGQGLRTGNTHVHIMKRTHAEAIHYLELVPAADDVDLVFLSHLRRIPDERHYISNSIVENSLAGGELARLSRGSILYRPGQEHRNNFTGFGQGYGHVMMLDIAKLIRPVSIGPGIMKKGTDGIPLQRGIQEARGDGATVVWCHNTFGLEDLPNWMSGTLDAQNIFDGGPHGSYKDTYYRYMNIGLKVPFSTGTDWFIYDFSRVYVPLKGKLTSKAWLKQLAAGRTFITNGPLLKLEANGKAIGDTIALDQPGKIKIVGSAIGRANYQGIELIHNGNVVKTAKVKRNAGHHLAAIETELQIDKPGWVALRIPLKAGKNEFGKDLFAHTSAIYVDVGGKKPFDRETAKQMLAEMKESVNVIKEKAVFATDSERDAVLAVHQKGIEVMTSRLSAKP